MEKEANINEDLSEHNTKTELFNVFLLGLCFCLVMGGFNTMGQTQVSKEPSYNFTFSFLGGVSEPVVMRRNS